MTTAAVWPPECEACGETLTEPGGILLGVPSRVLMVPKWHLCATCLHQVERFIRTARAVLDG